jgi:hypothetical protein
MRTKWITAVAAAAVVGSVAVVLVQSGGQPPAERTLTGCVRTGSAPAVFVLRGASAGSTESAPDGQQLPEDYLLVSIPRPSVSSPCESSRGRHGVVSDRALDRLRPRRERRRESDSTTRGEKREGARTELR